MEYPQRVTKEFLDKIDACQEAVVWWETVRVKTWRGQLKKCVEQDKPVDWILNGICRTLGDNDNRRLALFAARQVEPIYEKYYPNDDGIKKCNDATEAYLKNPNPETAAARAAAWDAAWDAAWAAAWDAARAAAWAAARAARAAAWAAARAAAWDAARAVRAAAWAAAWAAARDARAAARDAARAAAWDAARDARAAARDAADQEMLIRICEYGIKIIKGEV